jgi:ATP-dependent DNA ligase
MAKKPLPQFIEPMMASVVRDPFDNTDWIFETKLDGFRAIPAQSFLSPVFHPR